MNLGENIKERDQAQLWRAQKISFSLLDSEVDLVELG